jgi:hypothetical protein
MKLSTLIKRLAEKTDTPILEQVLLGEKGIEELPQTCILWTGSCGNKGRTRVKLKRDSMNRTQMVTEKEYQDVRVMFQGQRIRVPRLIFQLMFKPNYEYRLYRVCGGEDTCVNPLHWKMKRVEKEDTSLPPEPEIEPVMMGLEWTQEEVDEILELIFDQSVPRSFEELMQHDFLEDSPPEEMIRIGLQKMNKDYLYGDGEF